MTDQVFIKAKEIKKTVGCFEAATYLGGKASKYNIFNGITYF